MQEFLRRNFWVVHLAAIGIGAYLVAGVMTEVGASVFLKVPAPSAREAAPIAPPTKAVKPESRVSLASTLGGHNLFDAEPKVVEESDEEGGGAAEAAPVTLDLDVGLLGTLVASNEEWSLATIKAGGESKLVRIGLRVLDRASVVEIAPRYIILQEGQLRQVVRLWDDKAGKGGAKPSPAVAAIAAQPSDNFAKGVKKLGPTDYQIDRGMLEENLADLSKLGMQARIVPNYEDGKYHGFRLVGIRPDSLYKAIGLESGDLIKRVSGTDIDSPNKAIELFDKLRNSQNISLDLDRRGQKVTMNYTIK